ncbi:recombination mediator RecR [Mesoplasma photuris]|uniref:recombination mediator RecR n=1 Tax=Mesoplasma photuris TaxID=217731 RepID=UPI0004E0FDD4|nr:recombination mediator RecR [Mesoplasma photuris]
MNNFLLDEIIDELKLYEGLTKKTSERLINQMINHPDKMTNLIKKLNQVQSKISICDLCGYYQQEEKCLICDDNTRNKKIICVVATTLDAKNIEDKNSYKGLYAVLGNEINLNKKVTPADLKIDVVFNRIDEDTEIILALNATFEGELTSNYIAELCRKKGIKVSRLAKGIPLGGMIDYMDETTLNDSFKNRKKYEV